MDWRAASAGECSYYVLMRIGVNAVLFYGMDELAMLEMHLAEAERHLAEAGGHLRKQRRIFSELERDGRDTSLARELLITFEMLYSSHKALYELLTAEKIHFKGNA